MKKTKKRLKGKTMKPITFAIAGCGNRGTKYAAKLLDHPDTAEIAAIADNRAVRTAAIQRHIHLPENRVFDGIESLLEQPRLADVLIIATQDAQHKDHAIAALKKGYHLILEKPVSNRLEECAQIAQVAKECDRHVLVCHVLR